ncbi:GlxA family transcriptional regulator [Pseudomonas sp. HR96]|uniref:GlxA family transcriptional regulator n=1 Tax=Pseudomonas sp. HR96 TaxID=1027966 RepID=UPI002A75324D|nr:GlxA family transcriptional regulator [Pseudomonas sp. HR96]WPP00948.1 GlxA family transcriptional regulator [Pseudomonas sp. HR96]
MADQPRTIAILALPGVQLLDVCGPLDVFAEANRSADRALYQLRVLGTRPGPIGSSSGARLMADATLQDTDEAIDTLLVAGCPDAAQRPVDAALTQWLQRRAPGLRRLGSVCTGAFILARAGLLEGREVTTHWAGAEQLAAEFPGVRVQVDAIHVRDGKLRTAAGVTAGLDLALALVEEDHGPALARDVAAHLVMFFKRPGGQLQFSRKGEAVPTGRSALQEIQRYISAHPAADLSIEQLAKRAGLSPRHFARLFQAEVGETPAAWVEAARIERARQALEGGKLAPKQVAALCGFASVDVLRRAFTRRLGVSPAEFRRGFV